MNREFLQVDFSGLFAGKLRCSGRRRHRPKPGSTGLRAPVGVGGRPGELSITEKVSPTTTVYKVTSTSIKYVKENI